MLYILSTKICFILFVFSQNISIPKTLFKMVVNFRKTPNFLIYCCCKSLYKIDFYLWNSKTKFFKVAVSKYNILIFLEDKYKIFTLHNAKNQLFQVKLFVVTYFLKIWKVSFQNGNYNLNIFENAYKKWFFGFVHFKNCVK